MSNKNCERRKENICWDITCKNDILNKIWIRNFSFYLWAFDTNLYHHQATIKRLCKERYTQEIHEGSDSDEIRRGSDRKRPDLQVGLNLLGIYNESD